MALLSFQFLKRKVREQGTTLVEILVGMTIFGIVVMGISEFFRNTESTKKKLYLKRVMERLSNDLYHKTRDPISIFLSLRDEVNIDLRSCLYGGSSACTFTGASSSTGFRLNHRQSQNAVEAVSGLWGSDDGAVCYDTNLSSCSCAGDSLIGKTPCSFIAETKFYVSCQETDPTCLKGASSVHVSYRVRQREGTLRRFGRAMRDLPENEFYSHHSLQSIFNPSYNSECNTGAVMIGFNKSARAICECAPTFEQVGENNRGPICSKAIGLQHTCPEHMVPVSLGENNNIICKTLDQAYRCETYSGADAQTPCPSGSWVQKYYRKECRFHCSVNSRDGGECSNFDPDDVSKKIEDQFDSSNEKTGVWCYGEKPETADDPTDEKVCCYRVYDF